MGGEHGLSTLISRRDHLGVLRHVRAHRLRDPKLVVEHVTALLGADASATPSSLTTLERLAALEQLVLAATDLRDDVLAEKALRAIRSCPDVPVDSVRVRALVARCLEADDADEASAAYDGLTDENASNALAARRRVALSRARTGRERETLEALSEYLASQPGDASAWDLAADLRADAGDWAGAVHALEEVVLSSPLDADAHRRLGETYATAGGRVNLRLGRRHLAVSLELRSPERGNARALFSLVSVARSFLESSTTTSSSNNSRRQRRDAEDETETEVVRELVRYGGEKILSLYPNGTEMARIVREYVKRQTESCQL